MARNEGASWQQQDPNAWGGSRSDSQAYYDQLRESAGLYGGHHTKPQTFDTERIANLLSKDPQSATNQPVQSYQSHQPHQSYQSSSDPTPGKIMRAGGKREVEASRVQRRKDLQDMKKNARKYLIFVNIVTTIFAIVFVAAIVMAAR